ncbi:hypothetical protein ZIOFF_022173 [Zingiber officinale]|uniref:PSD13 N-terminal domain-containing protein n=1 Tax=Zingiber officinale TaxID=94328 RepID=A0A8J5HBK1_ZINOF|nr:hypothetical protein ZIOFF_022173 [Zingiber officinale]
MNLDFDHSLSCLLGDNIYNFGELLARPISAFRRLTIPLSIIAQRTRLSVGDNSIISQLHVLFGSSLCTHCLRPASVGFVRQECIPEYYMHKIVTKPLVYL